MFQQCIYGLVNEVGENKEITDKEARIWPAFKEQIWSNSNMKSKNLLKNPNVSKISI